jgi:hypothetical protein
VDSDTATVIVAACAVGASSFLAVRSLRAARADAWDYLGAQQCAAYREQVLALYEKGLEEWEIEEWFRLEKGGAENPHSRKGHKNGYDALADGCGSVSQLLALLPPRQSPTPPSADG